ncbi:MAG TPA: hypothetical protein VH062_36935 [Polyangiaceae bacterium]|jgi:hypothetical protein|nr:hypothetical protein [Polyangiaceae bacterium]
MAAVPLILHRRRAANPGICATLAELIAEGRVLMAGAVRQELLSGIRTTDQFRRLRLCAIALREDVPVLTTHGEFTRFAGISRATAPLPARIEGDGRESEWLRNFRAPALSKA